MKPRIKFIQLILTNYLSFVMYNEKVACTGLKDELNLPEDSIKKPLVGKYSLYRKSLSWGDSQIYCESHEGHLATFTQIEDLRAVIEKIFEMSDKPITTEYLSGAKQHEFGLDRRYWLGLTDLVSGEGNWVWAGKGQPLQYQTMWYPGQPDHIDKNGKYSGRPEHCVALWNPVFHKGDRRHTLVDQECKRKYYFLCETDTDKIAVQKEYKEHNKGKDSRENLGRSLHYAMKLRPRKHKKNQNANVTEENRKEVKLGRSANNMIESHAEQGERRNVSSAIQTAKSITTIKPAESHSGVDTWKSLPGFSELFEQSSSRENNLWDEEPLPTKKTTTKKASTSTTPRPKRKRSKSEEIADAELESVFG